MRAVNNLGYQSYGFFAVSFYFAVIILQIQASARCAVSISALVIPLKRESYSRFRHLWNRQNTSISSPSQTWYKVSVNSSRSICRLQGALFEKVGPDLVHMKKKTSNMAQQTICCEHSDTCSQDTPTEVALIHHPYLQQSTLSFPGCTSSLILCFSNPSRCAGHLHGSETPPTFSRRFSASIPLFLALNNLLFCSHNIKYESSDKRFGLWLEREIRFDCEL